MSDLREITARITAGEPDYRAIGTELANALEHRPDIVEPVINERVRAYSYLAALRRIIGRYRINMIVDAGAHRGQFAASAYGFCGFQGAMHSFEPVAEHFEHLQANTKYYAGWTAHHAALGDASGESTVWVGESHGGTSSLLRGNEMLERFVPEGGLGPGERIKVFTVDELFGGVLDDPATRAMLKIDTQGYEDRVIAGCGARLSRFRALHVELASIPMYEGQLKFGEMLHLAEEHGFVPVYVSNNFAAEPPVYLDFDVICLNQEEFKTPDPATLKSYSQTGEDIVISRELASVRGGRFLDIGAFHPFQFSNTRRLYEMGFKGVFVEPSPSLRGAFDREYGWDAGIVLMPVCVGARTGTATLWDSGGDAISSLIREETTKWTESFGTKFTPVEVEIITVPELLRRSPYKKFDFVNIDTEGTVWEIVQQIDFRALGCKVVCLEWNAREEGLFVEHLRAQGYGEIHRTAENLIFKAT